MLTESKVFAEPPNASLLRILSQIDLPAMPNHEVQEHRSGVSVSRWVPKPAQKARVVAMFASESSQPPASVSEYSHWAANVTNLPRKQLIHYKHASLEQARTLRCNWLDEHLYWGPSNRYANELSFAWIMAKRRTEGSIGPNLDDDPTWTPLSRDETLRGEQVFLRFLKRSDPEQDAAAGAASGHHT